MEMRRAGDGWLGLLYVRGVGDVFSLYFSLAPDDKCPAGDSEQVMGDINNYIVEFNP